MRLSKSIFFFLMFAASKSLNAQCVAIWDGAQDESYDTLENWSSGCVPNGVEAIAIFSSPTAPNQVDTDTLVADLKTLTFDTAAQSYLIEGDSNFTFSEPNSSINVFAGSHTIQGTSIDTTSVVTFPFNIEGKLTLINSLVEGDNILITSGGTLVNSSGRFEASDNFSVGNSHFINTNGASLQSGVLNLNGGSITNANFSAFNLIEVFILSGLFTNDSSSVVNFRESWIQNGGTFTNNGEVSDTGADLTYSLNDGGVVRGTGVFNVRNFDNSGNVIPGDVFPAPLNFGGTYTQNKNGTLTINFLDPTRFGSIVANEVVLADPDEPTAISILDLVALPGSTILSHIPYTIVSAATTRTGEFSQVLNHVSPYFDPSVTYLEDAVTVEFLSLFPGYLSPKEAIFSTQNQVNFLLLRQIDRMLSRGCCGCDCSFDLFAGPIASTGSVHGKADFVGYNFYTAGLMVGADYATPFGGLGVALDYEYLQLNGRNRWGRVDVNRLHGNLYGALRLIDCLSLNAMVGGGYDWNDFRRRELQDLSNFARSSPHSREFNALVGLEYSLVLCQVAFIPFIDYQYGYYDNKAVDERAPDGQYALSFPRQRFESNRSILGARLNTTTSLFGLCLIPEVNFAWEREFSNREKSVRGSLPYELNHYSVGRNTFLAGFDLEVPLCDDLSIDFSYEYEGNQRYINNFFYLGVNTLF